MIRSEISSSWIKAYISKIFVCKLFHLRRKHLIKGNLLIFVFFFKLKISPDWKGYLNTPLDSIKKKKKNLMLKINNLFLFPVKIKSLWFRELHITQCMTVLYQLLANSCILFEKNKYQCSSRDVYKQKDFYSETLLRIMKTLWMACITLKKRVC